MSSLNIQRVSKKFQEIYGHSIDVSDVKGKEEQKNNAYFTRALAATALMMRCDIEVDIAVNSITDGYHDMGIDAIYLDQKSNMLFLVQSKWRQDGKGSITQDEMGNFVEGIKRIISYDLEGANEKIQAKKDDIDAALDGIGCRIQALFIHTGSQEINDFIKRPMTELIASTNDEADENLLFSPIAFKEIYDYLASDNAASEVDIDYLFLNNWGKISTPYPMYYGTVPTAAIGELHLTYGDRLFDKNIRFYKGRTDVNDGIKKVLLKEPENFVYYNNGIKLLCKKIERNIKNSSSTESGMFTLKGVSVINGAQTTGCIGQVYKENPEKLENAKVLVQMIDMSDMPQNMGTSITKLSNTQNRIENKDFAALDPTQEKIKRELSFSHYQYLYKNGEEITDLSSQLSFDEAIVALACLCTDSEYSTIAKRNVGALSEDINKAPYKALFNNSTNSFELINSVMIVREVEKKLQKLKRSSSGKKYAACVHGNRLIEHIVLQNEKDKDGFSTSVWDTSTHLEEIDEIMIKSISIVSKELEETYCDSYPASVFKNQTKCKNIVNAVASSAFAD